MTKGKNSSPLGVAVTATILSALAVLVCCFAPVVGCPTCKRAGQFESIPPTDSDSTVTVILCEQCQGSKSFTLWEQWTDSMVRPKVPQSNPFPPPPPTTPPDAETRQRFETEGRALVADGKLQAALLKFAAAEGALDPPDYVRWRLIKTSADVQRMAGGSMGIRHRNVTPLKEMGPWALWVLVDGLGDNAGSPRFPAEGLLSDWGQEAVPSLCEAARIRNSRSRSGALSAIRSMGGSPYPKLPGLLKELWADPELDEGIKADVLELYVMIVHEPIDKK